MLAMRRHEKDFVLRHAMSSFVAGGIDNAARIRVCLNRPPHQLYRIGDLALESGETIKNLALSHVTHGSLIASESNAIPIMTAISAVIMGSTT